jgi:predicted MPP superfamily phosphohydrolase
MWNAFSVTALACGVALGLTTWLVIRAKARGRRVCVADLLAGALAAAAGSILVAFACATLGMSTFFLFHVFWFVLVAGLPLTAALALARAKVTRPAAVVLAATLVLAAVGVYSSVIEPDRLDIEHVSAPLAAARDGHAKVRIGVISDIQSRFVGAHELRAMELLMAERPDIILIAGDVHQSDEYPAHQDELRAMLRRLEAPGGVYLVQGDSDERWTTPLMVEGTGVELLDNRTVTVGVRDRRVTIGGIDVDYASSGARRVENELEEAPGTGDIRLLLAHRPDAVLDLRANSRVDLVAAGHTHGGQISIPGFGPLLTLTDVPRAVAAGGLHALDGRLVYVSTGVGLERWQAPQVRFAAVPTIGVIDLG